MLWQRHDAAVEPDATGSCRHGSTDRRCYGGISG